MTSTSAPDLQLVSTGHVDAADQDYLRRKVAAALHRVHEPVLSVRAKLTVLGDPAAVRPSLAQVNVNLNGRMLRAQAARETMREAIDEVHDRLRDRLDRATGDWEAIRGRRPLSEPHEWRHTSVHTEHRLRVVLSPEQRRVIRHKTFGLRRMSVDEAAFDMGLLGYQFHLFTEIGTGSDSVLYLVDDDPRYRLSQLDPQPDRVKPATGWASVSLQHPPVLAVPEAIERLDVSGWPFVFFEDSESRRGCVLYHRFDGNYGLITPAE